MVGKALFLTPDDKYIECVCLCGYREAFEPPPHIFKEKDIDHRPAATACDHVSKLLDWLDTVNLTAIYESDVKVILADYQLEDTLQNREAMNDVLPSIESINDDFDYYRGAWSRVLALCHSHPAAKICMC